ncbi:MAG: IgGFc-binding protein [Paludibacteraceae bacterium]|nr:IgGFc-binding protein [Paludibacteraceae bacterium]
MKRIQWIIALAVLMSLPLDNWAQAPVNVTPVTTTEGYDFFVTWLLNGNRGPGDQDLNLQLLISSREDNNITIEYTSGITANVNVAGGSTEVVDLKEIIGAKDYTSVYPDLEKGELKDEKALPKGVRLYSKINKKFTVYAVNKIGTNVASSSFDGAHVLPREALGYEYVIQTNSNDIMATQFAIVSTVPGKTNVTVNLPDGVQTNAGKTGTITITDFSKEGLVYFLRSVASDTGAGEDTQAKINLSGTTICSDQPIAVFSGNQAAVYPVEMASTGDFAFDQLLPISHWGKQFIVPMMKYEASTIKRNRLNVSVIESNTTVTLSGAGNGTWTSAKIGDTHEFDLKRNAQSESGVYVVNANQPVQVYLYSSSAIANADGVNTPSDPSATLIPPLDFLTDTTIFRTYAPPSASGELENRLVLWARTSETSTIRLNGNPVTGFAAVNGIAGYSYVDMKVDDGTYIVTAPKKSFSGYAYGLANGQAYLYPIGYDYMPVQDSLFLYGKQNEFEVHTSEWNAKYPDNGGWYMEKVELPKQPTQFDTVFVCDSTKLRFPVRIHNNWADIKWEVMRINQSNQKRTEYKDDAAVRQTGDLTQKTPFIETEFYMLPEKNLAPNRRHPYEDFEVRAILYQEPTLCEDVNEENWPKDTLSAIVRAYRIYNDTTWLIRCTNDKAIDNFFVDPETKEKTVINCDIDNPVTEDNTHIQLQPGENGPYQRHYTTVNGCDSIVTLYVLLCKSDVTIRPADYICESQLADITSQFDGDFFKDYRLAETLARHKKEITQRNVDQNRDFGDGWTYWGGKTDQLARTWQFKGTDVIRTTDCNADMQAWNSKYGAAYPRATVGCDRSLTIELHVLTMVEYEYEDVECNSSYTWHINQNRDNPGASNNNIDTTINRSKEGYGSHTFYHYYTPKSNRELWKDAPKCPTELHILNLTFTDGTVNKPKELCDDDPVYVISQVTDPNIKDPEYKYEFDPKGKRGTIAGPTIPCVKEDGCEYDLKYTFIVNEVERHNDTIVYCFEDGSTVRHKWDGHRMPWVQVKGQPDKTRTRYNDASKPLDLKRDQKNQIIYELTDTTLTSSCHIVYRQTVIMMPEYYTADRHDAISTEEWFEWQNIIWAGEDVRTNTISNPKNLTIVTLKEFGRVVPDGYTVEYFRSDSLYAITTTTTTVPHKRENGSWTAVCDSTVQLTVQVAHVQREKSYWYTCACDSIYTWYAGGVTPVEINLKHFGDNNVDYTTIKDSITVHMRRDDLLSTTAKRIDPNDSRKGQPSYGVAGIKAEFDHYLTIFPAYVTYLDTTVCQEPGKTITFKGVSIALDEYGPTKEQDNDQKTKPKTWINPNTYGLKPSYEVQCDSGEIVRAIVMPLYRDDLNKALSTHKPTLHSHDTLRFFTEPEILFVGMDFFTTHPQIANMAELKEKAGVDSVVLVDAMLVPELANHDESHYECEQKSSNGSQVLGDDGLPLGCDSTTFLDLQLKKANILPPVEIGDNGHWMNAESEDLVWSFGGDTAVRYDGSRYHTQYYMDGDYFRFYYDENGNVIGEVPFDEEESGTRMNAGRGDRNYSENEDGTRTYLLIDSVLNVQTGKFEVYVQAVTVYPTYLINYLKKMPEYEGEEDPIKDVCAEDVITCPWSGEKVQVADLPTRHRIAEFRDTLWQERFKPLEVDSIIYMKLRVWGNPPTTLNHSHCYNAEPYKWRNIDGLSVNSDVVFDPLQLHFDFQRLVENPHQVITDTLVDEIILPKNPELTCKDYLTLIVQWMPAYGIQSFKGQAGWFDGLYIDPYVAKTTYCFGDQHPHWILPDGTEHIPANLYDQDGNKIADNRIPTDLEIGATYIVRDSLKTKGCQCDSVLTLYYTLEEAPAHVDTTLTACEKEVVNFKGVEIPISRGMENPMEVVIDNGTGCPETYTLHFVIDELTRFSDVKAGPICYGATEYDYASYTITYSYKGTYAPVSYSVYYSDEAKDSLHVYDLKDLALPGNLNPGEIYELTIPLPAIDGKEDYPTPGVYKADVAFNNGKCASDEFMKTEIQLDVRYPSWIMQQRHGDMIVIRDSADNGNRRFTAFQWYKDGRELPGQVGPYLYMPGGLEPGAEYYVLLTEPRAAGDTIVAPVCALTAVADPGDDPHGPTYDYLDVVPTCVPVGRTTINIVSNETNKGTYRLSTIEGQYISSGEFTGPATAVTIPSVEGMYIVQVWADNKESIEPYRAIKVVVGSLCQD